MQFIREKLTGQFADLADGQVLEALGGHYQPVIYGAAQELYKYLPQEVASRTVRGDLFMTPTRDLLYYTFSPDYKTVVAGAVCNSVRARLDYGKFRDALSRILGGDSWQSDHGHSVRFKELAEETKTLSVGDWERKVAEALKRGRLRQMIRQIASRPSVSLQDVACGCDVYEVGQDVQLLEELGIITREFEVYCVDTKQKISCVGNMAAIEEASAHGFKCFHCGRPISAERVVQSLSITESGRHLAIKNMWLVYIVAAALIDGGVSRENISFRCEHNNDIVELFADVEGSLCMFTVSETAVTADAAYRFLNRNRFFGPQWNYLVTPVPVCNDAKAVLSSDASGGVFISGLEELPHVVEECVNMASHKVLNDLLVSFDAYTELSVGHWASDYLLCKGERPDPDSFSKASTVETEKSDDEAVASNDVQRPETETLKVSSESSANEDDTLCIATIDSVEKSEEQVPVTIPEPSNVANQKPATIDEPVNTETNDAPVVEEALDFKQIVSEVMAKLPKACENNDLDEVNALIGKADNCEGCSLMVATSDGLPFLGYLSTLDDSDMVAALQLDLMQNITNIAQDNNLGNLEKVIICNDSSTLRLCVVAMGDLNVITHTNEAEIEMVGKARKSSSVKLKKALQGLAALPSVNGSMLLKVDGELVQAVGMADEKRLASCFAQMINDVAKVFCADVAFGELRAMAVNTDKAVYHMMCLGDTHYLVNILGHKAPEFVWRSDIPAEAGIVAACI